MVSAISSSPLHAAYVGPSLGGLEAQLDQYKGKLADWENCPSCKTAEGKAKIAEIGGKISELKARMEAIATAKELQRTTVADVDASTGKRVESSATSLTEQNGTSATERSSSATVGSRLDIFA